MKHTALLGALWAVGLLGGCKEPPRGQAQAPAAQPAATAPREVAPGIAPWDQAEPPAPALAPPDQEYLLGLADATLDTYLSDGTLFQAEEPAPPSLPRRRHRVRVVLVCRGERWGTARTAEGDLREVVRLAVLEAAGSASFSERWRRAARSVDGAPPHDERHIILEIAGPRQYVPGQSAETICAPLIPGIHGLGVRDGQAEAEVFPSEVVTSHADADDLMRRLAPQALFRRNPIRYNGRGAYFYRFRSLAFARDPVTGEVQRYIRGVRLVDQGEIDRHALRQALPAGAAYLVRSQNRDGRFPHTYEPWSDRRTHPATAHETALAAWGLARAGGLTGHADTLAAARQAVSALLRSAARLDQRDADGLYVTDENGRHLGATARALLALLELGPAGAVGDLADRRHDLCQGILARVDEAGRPTGAFAASARDEVWEAIVALCLATEALGAERAEAVAGHLWRAHLWGSPQRPSATGRPAKSDAPEDAAQFILASSALYDLTGETASAEALFPVADWLARHQFRPGALKPTTADCLGGWEGRQGAARGIQSAGLVEAMAAAIRAAQALDRSEAAARYGQALAYGCRYLLQLQYRSEDTWAAARPAAVLGGFREALVDHTLASEGTGRALLALGAVLRGFDAESLDRFADPAAPMPSTRAAARPEVHRRDAEDAEKTLSRENHRS